MASVGNHTGRLVGTYPQTHSCRTTNHGRDHRLRKARQGTYHTGSHTTRTGYTDTAAPFIAETNDIANDHVQKTRGLHNADKEQDTRHIGNHWI